MTSNTLFFTLWEALNQRASVGFKFKSKGEDPSMTASVFIVTGYHFVLNSGEGVAHELAKCDARDAEEAQRRLMSLIENGSVESVTLCTDEGDWVRETTRREEGGWTTFANED
jgi:hypothetical protein